MSSQNKSSHSEYSDSRDFLLFYFGVVDSTGSASLEMSSIPARKRMEVRHISASNEDNVTNDYIEIGIVRGSRRFPLKRVAGSISANTPVTYDRTIHISGDERIYAEFSGATDGDNVKLLILGEYV